MGTHQAQNWSIIAAAPKLLPRQIQLIVIVGYATLSVNSNALEWMDGWFEEKNLICSSFKMGNGARGKLSVLLFMVARFCLLTRSSPKGRA